MDGITLSKIAHELRTPLTLINSTLQLIEAQIPQMKELTYWIQLNEDFRDMNDLVDNLTSLPDTVETNEDITLEKGMFNHRAEFFEEVYSVRPVIKQKRTL